MFDKILDGKKISKSILEEIKNKIKKNILDKKRPPCLAVLIVGSDPASEIYVSRKIKTCENIGFTSKYFNFEQTSSEEKIIEVITSLNENETVDGILVQLPLPKHLNTHKIINHIIARKDVDGLTTINQGLLTLNRSQHIPCTPKGIMTILKSYDIAIEGQISCVIGRSILVGSPMVKLLNQANSTVINVHSKSIDPQKICKQADIIICAAGVPSLVDDRWIKKDCTIIDVGIHRINQKLCGDVHFEKVYDKVRYITPVPGGVGPMTICSLLENCYESYLKTISI